MQIALFTDTYLPQINGVATHVKTLKEGLESIGHTVLVVTADTSAKEHYIEDGILRCPAVAVRHLYNYGAAASYDEKRQKILDRYSFDVVHIHTEFGIGWSGVRTARRAGIPLIYTLHTMWDQYLHYIVPKPLVPATRRLMREYIGYYGKIADEVIGPSLRVQGFLETCGIYREIHEIPNAVELEMFSREKADTVTVQLLRRKYGIESGDMVICFCGRLGKEKNVDGLLRIFAAHYLREDRMKLMLIGDGPMRNELKELAEALGVADSVIFTGAVPHAEIREVYACCDFYATASRSEVNSISMLEAMAMGLPVLHILDEENPGQIKEGVNGLLFRTAEDFHGALYHMKNAPDKRRRLQASAAESVRASGQAELARKAEAVYLKQCAAHMDKIRDI